MPLIQQALRPFARVAHLLFRCQLRLRLRGGMRLEWMAHGAQVGPSPEAQRAARAQVELDLIVQQLAALLDEDADTRSSLRHLSFVEQALREQGLMALHQVPLEVLTRALDQFEGFVTNWEPRGLASLRSRMSVEVSRRGDDDEEAAVVHEQPPAVRTRSAPARAVSATTV